jgi:GTPase-associated protein 1
MPIIKALQHLFSSVERGYDPRRKGGFQTVGVTEELTGTEDLRALEDAAFYALSRERRAARDFPVKQTIFRLPSGRFALGRTVDWGTDSLGREGNYLTYHLVFSRDDLLTAGADPFAILEAARLGEKMAEGSFDMSPRALPPLAVEIAPSGIDFHGFEGIKPELLANLTAAAVDGGEKTVLLIGDETLAEGVLRGVYASMATEERLRLTFATHFYESHHLRSFFTLATVRSREEVPSRRENYLVFDLGDGEFPRISPASAYAGWLADCLHSRRWEEIGVLNAFLDGVRNGRGEAGKDALPIGTKACAALWERAGEKVVQALLGDVGLTVEFLRKLSSSRPLADALLAAASPAKLCGPNATSDAAQACLAALRSAASGKAWREWVKKWSDDLALGSFATDTQAWWQRWKRRNE